MKTIRKILIRYYERKVKKLDLEILKARFDEPALASILTGNRTWYERKIKLLKESA